MNYTFLVSDERTGGSYLRRKTAISEINSHVARITHARRRQSLEQENARVLPFRVSAYRSRTCNSLWQSQEHSNAHFYKQPSKLPRASAPVKRPTQRGLTQRRLRLLAIRPDCDCDTHDCYHAAAYGILSNPRKLFDDLPFVADEGVFMGMQSCEQLWRCLAIHSRAGQY